MNKLLITLLLMYASLGAITNAYAERADRHKPVDIDADRVSVDDKNKVHIFEGNVQLNQGTLQILANKVVVTQTPQGFQKATATGGADGLARFKQKREGKDEMIEGEAERIDYDSQTERAQLFVRAHVKSGRDEVRGPYIEYDGYTENYAVNNGNNLPSTSTGRVHVTIQPKNKPETSTDAKPTPATETPTQQ